MSKTRCVWTEDTSDDFWNTGCGQAWSFFDGGPKENGCRFCPYCGGRLVVSGGEHDK